jgi:Protein of unknown function (DUF3102)
MVAVNAAIHRASRYIEHRASRHIEEQPYFDYDSVPPEVKKFLQGQAERIRRQASTSIIQIGRALINAKRYLSHGAFIIWVENEAWIPARTAQVYMRIAEWVSGKNAAAAHLPPSVLQLLSAPSTPKEFVDGVLARFDAGEPIIPSVVRRDLKVLRQAQRETLQKMTSSSVSRDNSSAEGTGTHRGGADGASTDAATTLRQAVAIMARGLSREDFERVRAMLTSAQVLDAPQLARAIAASFSHTSMACNTRVPTAGT